MNTKTFIFWSVTFALVGSLFMFASDSQAARGKRAGGCGRGCQRQMGSCTVKENLWAAFQKSGFTSRSCCRSEEYNRRLRSCGYGSATNSMHMYGNAIDLSIPPRLCNQRALMARGFPCVAPYYHGTGGRAYHCHVPLCGTEAGRRGAVAKAKERAKRGRQIRQQRNNSQQRPWENSGREDVYKVFADLGFSDATGAVR